MKCSGQWQFAIILENGGCSKKDNAFKCGTNAVRETDIDRIILEIYESATQPELWEGVIGGISDAMNSGGINLMIADRIEQKQIIGVTARMPENVHEDYVRDYFPEDSIRVKRVMEQPIGSVFRANETLTPQELRTNAFVNEFQPKHELANLTGSNLSVGKYFVWLGTARGTTENPFTAEEMNTLRRFVPHVRKSVRLALHLRDLDWQRGALSKIFDADARAVLLIDRTGKIAFSNDFFRRYVERKIAYIDKGRLGFLDRRLNTEFRICLKNLFDLDDIKRVERHAFIVSEPADDQRDHGLRVFRFFGDIRDFGRTTGEYAVVLLHPLTMLPLPDSDEVRRFGELYGLTAAEVSVVHSIANLETVSDFAKVKGIQTDTARGQLKSAMSKTGVGSQKHLIRVLERFCFLAIH